FLPDFGKLPKTTGWQPVLPRVRCAGSRMARVALKSEASAFKKLVFIRVDSWLVEAPMKIRITSDVRSIAVAAALPWLVAVIPAGETLGDANSVNASTVAVGSVDAGSLQRGAIYSGGSGTIITQTTVNGSYFLTAFGINDSGRIVGQGIDPTNAARNVGIVYDIGQSMAFEVGALPGMNGALAFGVSNTGYVVGPSMLNQGSGLPFIWSDQGGIVAIPLASGTSQGSARAVN